MVYENRWRKRERYQKNRENGFMFKVKRQALEVAMCCFLSSLLVR
jgi:hypothetical protein